MLKGLEKSTLAEPIMFWMSAGGQNLQLPHFLVDQSINQPINQSISQSVSQSINQSVNQSNKEKMKKNVPS